MSFNPNIRFNAGLGMQKKIYGNSVFDTIYPEPSILDGYGQVDIVNNTQTTSADPGWQERLRVIKIYEDYMQKIHDYGLEISGTYDRYNSLSDELKIASNLASEPIDKIFSYAISKKDVYDKIRPVLAKIENEYVKISGLSSDRDKRQDAMNKFLSKLFDIYNYENDHYSNTDRYKYWYNKIVLAYGDPDSSLPTIIEEAINNKYVFENIYGLNDRLTDDWLKLLQGGYDEIETPVESESYKREQLINQFLSKLNDIYNYEKTHYSNTDRYDHWYNQIVLTHGLDKPFSTIIKESIKYKHVFDKVYVPLNDRLTQDWIKVMKGDYDPIDIPTEYETLFEQQRTEPPPSQITQEETSEEYSHRVSTERDREYERPAREETRESYRSTRERTQATEIGSFLQDNWIILLIIGGLLLYFVIKK